MDYEFSIEKIKREVGYDDFNEVVQDTVKQEPYINILSECGRFDECFSSETDQVDHHNATYSYQEQKEEMPDYVDPSKVNEELSRNECRTEQINDIFFEDIKREIGEEEVNELRFCQVCNKSFIKKTHFVKSNDEKLHCICQEPNYSGNSQGDDVDRDVKYFSLIPTTDDSLLPKRKRRSISVENDPCIKPEMNNETEKQFKCKICSESLTNVDSRYCKTCQKFSSRSAGFTAPERLRTAEKAFTCKICSKSFRHLQTLKNHKNIHTGEKLFPCKICPKTFIISGNLKAHERVHTEEKPFHCKLCSKSFSRLGTLKIHERSHTGERPYHCKICSNAFISNSTLKDHEKIHSREKPFHCKVCSKSFKRAKTLKGHEIIHTEEKPYPCKVCSKSFRSMRYLTVHEKNHAEEKPFQCKICLKSFKLAKTLKVHGSIHLREKPFNCENCSKSFNYSRDLKTHERVHTGERPYICKICSKSYISKASLRVHTRIHTEFESERRNFEKSRNLK